MSAELRLVLRAEAQPDLEGWWVASGSSCREHEIGVLVIVSPAEAARITAGTTPAEAVRARLRCVAQAFTRAAALLAPGTHIRLAEFPLNDPRRS